MKIFKAFLLCVLFSTALGRYGKRRKLKNQVKELAAKVAYYKRQTDDRIRQLSEQINNGMKVVPEPDEGLAWQSLHMAAAAACRGSTATGGSGMYGNAVIAKENTRSCAQVCAGTEWNICDADVSISGYYGKAGSYTERLGHFYNYDCGSPGNTNVKFDEVKADGGDVFKDVEDGHWYYRFCCCRR